MNKKFIAPILFLTAVFLFLASFLNVKAYNRFYTNCDDPGEKQIMGCTTNYNVRPGVPLVATFLPGATCTGCNDGTAIYVDIERWTNTCPGNQWPNGMSYWDFREVECCTGADCPSSKPYCHKLPYWPPEYECVECSSDWHCNDPAKPVCNYSSKTCVECNRDSDCSSGMCVNDSCVPCNYSTLCKVYNNRVCDVDDNDYFWNDSKTQCDYWIKPQRTFEPDYGNQTYYVGSSIADVGLETNLPIGVKQLYRQRNSDDERFINNNCHNVANYNYCRINGIRMTEANYWFWVNRNGYVGYDWINMSTDPPSDSVEISACLETFCPLGYYSEIFYLGGYLRSPMDQFIVDTNKQCIGNILDSAVAWEGDDSELEGVLEWQYADPGTDRKCEFKCAEGYLRIGDDCVPDTNTDCYNFPLEGAIAWDDEESGGLLVSLPWTYSETDTEGKCQYRCDTISGYVFDEITGQCIKSAEKSCASICRTMFGENSVQCINFIESATGPNTPLLLVADYSSCAGASCGCYCASGYIKSGNTCIIIENDDDDDDDDDDVGDGEGSPTSGDLDAVDWHEAN